VRRAKRGNSPWSMSMAKSKETRKFCTQGREVGSGYFFPQQTESSFTKDL